MTARFFGAVASLANALSLFHQKSAETLVLEWIPLGYIITRGKFSPNVSHKLFRKAQEITSSAQRDSGRRFGEQIAETTFWQHELSAELEKLLAESSLLAETRRSLEKAAKDCDGPLHVAQECLYHRENRQGYKIQRLKIHSTKLFYLRN